MEFITTWSMPQWVTSPLVMLCLTLISQSYSAFVPFVLDEPQVCFTEEKGHVIQGGSRKRLLLVDLPSCQRICIEGFAGECRSFNYFPNLRTCLVFDVDKRSRKLVEHRLGSYYENRCAQGFIPPTSQPSPRLATYRGGTPPSLPYTGTTEAIGLLLYTRQPLLPTAAGGQRTRAATATQQKPTDIYRRPLELARRTRAPAATTPTAVPPNGLKPTTVNGVETATKSGLVGPNSYTFTAPPDLATEYSLLLHCYRYLLRVNGEVWAIEDGGTSYSVHKVTSRTDCLRLCFRKNYLKEDGTAPVARCRNVLYYEWEGADGSLIRRCIPLNVVTHKRYTDFSVEDAPNTYPSREWVGANANQRIIPSGQLFENVCTQ